MRVKALVVNRGSFNRWHNRYALNLANEFTGHARGRTAINYDLHLMEFWDKVLKTPMGRRIDKVAGRLFGPQTVEGLTAYSPAMKLTNLMTGNIFRAALGLNLSSSLRNLSQVSNFAVAHGMPATIKGMLKFHDEGLRAWRCR